MAFSTLRHYSGSHAMSPTVQASRGAGGAPGAGGSIPAAQGSPANDLAALGGMGAVGAGLLGKYLYDEYGREGEPLFQYDNPTAGPNAGPDGNFDISNAMNAADTPQGPALPNVHEASAPVVQDGYDFAGAAGNSPQFNVFGSGNLGQAAMNGVSPLIRAAGLDDNLAELQAKLGGFDPLTGLWGNV